MEGNEEGYRFRQSAERYAAGELCGYDPVPLCYKRHHDPEQERHRQYVAVPGYGFEGGGIPDGQYAHQYREGGVDGKDGYALYLDAGYVQSFAVDGDRH